MFIDYAELMAEDGILMSMQDWVDQTNQFLLNNRRKVLNGKGKISHDVAMQKAEKMICLMNSLSLTSCDAAGSSRMLLL